MKNYIYYRRVLIVIKNTCLILRLFFVTNLYKGDMRIKIGQRVGISQWKK